jgi:hypothetical protein
MGVNKRSTTQQVVSRSRDVAKTWAYARQDCISKESTVLRWAHNVCHVTTTSWFRDTRPSRADERFSENCHVTTTSCSRDTRASRAGINVSQPRAWCTVLYVTSGRRPVSWHETASRDGKGKPNLVVCRTYTNSGTPGLDSTYWSLQHCGLHRLQSYYTV